MLIKEVCGISDLLRRALCCNYHFSYCCGYALVASGGTAKNKAMFKYLNFLSPIDKIPYSSVKMEITLKTPGYRTLCPMRWTV